MQKTIVTALAILASTAVASATDLPSKTKAPIAPAPVFTEFYVGGNIGGDLGSSRVYSGGVVAGWNVLPFLAVEGTYDLTRTDKKVDGAWNYGNKVAVNVVPQYKISGTNLTAYLLGGVGYKWNTKIADYAVYNIGGGMKYEFAKNVELDARYRRIDAVKTQYRNAEDRITVGVNYKF